MSAHPERPRRIIMGLETFNTKNAHRCPVCGLKFNLGDVAYDETSQRWAVDLKKDAHQLKTFLEDGDAELCLQGKQCVSLGIEIGQLRGNIERL